MDRVTATAAEFMYLGAAAEAVSEDYRVRRRAAQCWEQYAFSTLDADIEVALSSGRRGGAQHSARTAAKGDVLMTSSITRPASGTFRAAPR